MPTFGMSVKKLGLVLAGASGLLGLQALFAARRALVLHPPVASEGNFGDPKLPELRFVVIGDSTSVGVGASRIEATYPWALGRHLGERFRVRLTVLGRSGARIKDALGEFVEKGLECRPDLVLVGIGANDVTHITPLGRFGRDLAEVIEILIAARSQVIVALGPRFDAPALPQPLRMFARARARALNGTIRKVAARKGVEVLDLPRAVGSAFALDRSLYCADGFHPSDRGYSVWAESMKGQVMAGAEKAVAARRRDLSRTDL